MREKDIAITFDLGKMIIRKAYSVQDSPASDAPLQVSPGFFDLSMRGAEPQEQLSLSFNS
jgi:hypothetical protein